MLSSGHQCSGEKGEWGEGLGFFSTQSKCICLVLWLDVEEKTTASDD